jgi:hypothetical protein
VPACETLWWYDNDHQYCQQKKFCGAYIYLGLHTFKTEAECKTALGGKSLTLTSPNGGEVWKTGETYDITWKATGVDKINIFLQTFAEPGGPSAAIGAIATNVSASTGKYSWTIPYSISMTSGMGLIGQNPIGTNRQVVISEVGGTTSDGGDKPFTIVAGVTCDQKCKNQGYESGTCQSFAVSPEGFAAQEEYEKTHTAVGYTSDCYLPLGLVGSNRSCYCSIKKSLTLTSPNGGEQWEVGKTYDITWKAEGINKINLFLTGSKLPGGISEMISCLQISGAKCQGPCSNLTIAQGIDASLGKYSWTIPTNQSLYSDAKIHIQEYVSDIMTETCLQDSSDNYFSLVPNLTLKNIENQLASLQAAVSQIIERVKGLLGR